MGVAFAQPTMGYTTEDNPVTISEQELLCSPVKRRRKSITRKARLVQKVYLKHTWSLWYDESNSASCCRSEDIKKIGSFDTIQGFWQFYNSFVDPANFPQPSNLRIFKEGVTPVFEQPHHTDGGKWTIPCSKSDTCTTWMKLLLAMIGEQFSSSAFVSGMILSVRPIMDNIILCNTTQAGTDEISHHLSKLTRYTSSSTSQLDVTTAQKTQQEAANVVRRFVSAYNLTKEDIDVHTRTQSHKKSSSFSTSSFPY